MTPLPGQIEPCRMDAATEAAVYPTVDSLLALLASIEWSATQQGPGSGPHFSGGDGQHFKACPKCGGIRPRQGADGHFVQSAIGHKADCELNRVLHGG